MQTIGAYSGLRVLAVLRSSIQHPQPSRPPYVLRVLRTSSDSARQLSYVLDLSSLSRDARARQQCQSQGTMRTVHSRLRPSHCTHPRQRAHASTPSSLVRPPQPCLPRTPIESGLRHRVALSLSPRHGARCTSDLHTTYGTEAHTIHPRIPPVCPALPIVRLISPFHGM